MRRLVTVCLLIIIASAAALAAEQPNTLKIRSLKILAVIYRGTPEDKDRLTDEQIQYVKNGLDYARLFYFRNTQCRLNLDIHYLLVDEAPPKHDGPTYDNIVEDLRARGVKDNEYDGLYSTGIRFTGCYGGFRIFDKTAGAFSTCTPDKDFDWWPESNPKAWFTTTWMFTHEFQHALDLIICDVNSGRPEMLHGHPYADCKQKYFWWGHSGAQHFDWQAHTLTSFKNYLSLKTPNDLIIEAVDADGDGMPDDDPRLPMDEKRFGSDPTKKDTDGDGLDDLQEFCADVFRGSDPRNPDTDGDGIPDGKDRHPTVAIAETISYTAADPKIDGVLDECYKPFTMGMYADNAPELAKARMFACWNEDALHLFLKSEVKCNLIMTVDSSPENGYWEGGDTYLIKVTPEGEVLFNGLGLKGPVPNAKAAWGADGLEMTIPAMIGQGVSGEINFGGKRRQEDVVDGMSLLADGWVSFDLRLENGADKALITPSHSMFDVQLDKKPSDPSKPSLRFSKRVSNIPNPIVTVTGVSPDDIVTIVNQDGVEIGRRIGSGDVELIGEITIGHDELSGINTVMAKVGNYVSDPIQIVVDIMADTPETRLLDDGETYEICGEPNARVEIRAGVKPKTGRRTEWPVISLELDETGTATFNPESLSEGFVGAYCEGKQFNRPVFWRIDPEIKFDFGFGSPDPKIPSDFFGIRWIGFLMVPETGNYTFYLGSDDGSRLAIGGKEIIDNWEDHSIDEGWIYAEVYLEKGEHTIAVDYYEEGGGAAIHLEWSGPGFERTYALPVSHAPTTHGEVTYFIRQIDKAGNVSPTGIIED